MDSPAVSPIREARIKKGLSQTELGKSAGVSKSAVSAWESDREFPDIRKLARISRALKPHFSLNAYVLHVERRAG